MNQPSRWRLSRRQRSIGLSWVGTLSAIVVLTVALRARQAWYDTDLSDPSSGITSYSTDFTGQDAAPEIRFRDVAEDFGFRFQHGPPQRSRRLCEDTGSGLAWADYDGDGDFDLYVVNDCGSAVADKTPLMGGRLFRNDGDRFTDVTRAAGVANPAGRGMAASWADFDDDGVPDLYVTNFGSPNRLYRNQGDGTFREAAAEAGAADSIWSTGVCWGDFDRDGNLDLYVCGYVDYDLRGLSDERLTREQGRDSIGVPFALNPNAFDPLPNRLYRSLGDGRFEEVAEAVGVANRQGRSFSAAAVDLDGDGWLDLYVANDVAPNALFRNVTGQPDLVGDDSGRLTFWDLSAITGTADFRGSMGLSIAETGELTGAADGLPDLFYTNWLAQENGLYQSQRMATDEVEYRDRARPVRLAEDSLEMVGWGCGFTDLDLDGRVDLLIVNGSTLEQSPERTRLIPQRMFVYWNDGRAFRNVAPQAGEAASGAWCARGLAMADFDDDGRNDLAISVNRGPVRLLRNETSTENRALKIRLRGPSAACFGAKVEVTTGGRTQTRWWGADVSYLSGHAPEQIFGLGRNHQADAIRIDWADGRTTRFSDLPAGKLVVDWRQGDRDSCFGP